MSKDEGAPETEAPSGEKAVDNQAIAAIIREDADSDTETPQSYNKLKYHSSKMDLNLKILREEMANLQDSGNSLSRQFASMYRTFQEMKENEDEKDQEYSDYDQYSNDDVDSQCADGRDDGIDTEDDVNRMSDLETDYSSRSTSSKRKKQQKRPPPLQMEPQERHFEKDPNDNEIRTHSLPAEADEDVDQAQNSDFYPDFETSSSEECSHCLCCSSLASYSSGIPWKYVDKSASSAPEYESDSSEYCSDSDNAPDESPMPLYKRLSPFFYQECYAEVEDEVPVSEEETNLKEGTTDGDDEESVPEKRMSPLGCESPKPSSSRGSSQPDVDEECDKQQENEVVTDKRPAFQNKDTHTPQGKFKDPRNPGPAKVKQAISKTETKENATCVKADIQDKPNTSKSQPLPKKANESAATRPKVKTETDRKNRVDSPTISADDESNVLINVKDRIKNFEAQKMENVTGQKRNNHSNSVKKKKIPGVIIKETQSNSLENKEQSVRTDNVFDEDKQDNLSEMKVANNSNVIEELPRSKVKPPDVKSKPRKSSSAHKISPVLPKQEDSQGQCSEKIIDVPRHVSKSIFRVKTPEREQQRNENQEVKRKPRPSSTIEIPVQFLSSKGKFLTTPEGAVGIHSESDALTFKVRPIAADTQGPPDGPFIITSSPKPKRKISKQVVQLSQGNEDVSEQSTLRPEPQGRVQPQILTEGVQREHPICPHCHKKAVPPEERKRNVQVLQLQPVSDTELPPTPTTPTPQASITFEAPPPQPVQPARIIKVIPAGKQQLLMQRQPAEEPRSVHFRLNMGGPQAVPIRIGDYIRIPLKPGQARGVRVIFN